MVHGRALFTFVTSLARHSRVMSRSVPKLPSAATRQSSVVSLACCRAQLEACEAPILDALEASIESRSCPLPVQEPRPVLEGLEWDEDILSYDPNAVQRLTDACAATVGSTDPAVLSAVVSAAGLRVCLGVEVALAKFFDEPATYTALSSAGGTPDSASRLLTARLTDSRVEVAVLDRVAVKAQQRRKQQRNQQQHAAGEEAGEGRLADLATRFWRDVLIPETKALEVAVLRALAEAHEAQVEAWRAAAGIPPPPPPALAAGEALGRSAISGPGSSLGLPSGWCAEVVHLDAAGSSLPVAAAVDRQVVRVNSAEGS